MARLVLASFLLILWVVPVRADEEATVVPGLITANNVDVTADDASLLPDRLNIGDTMYIVVNPKKKKDGWVRVTRSADDITGVGWVESKYIRTVSRYRAPKEEQKPTEAETSGEKTIIAPDVEKLKYSHIGILPFQGTDADDRMAKSAYDAFNAAVRNDGHFQLADTLKNEKVDVEELDALKRVVNSYQLDGVFVGKLSGDMGGGRLLQVKFYGKDREGFVLEKVTRLSKEGNLKAAVDKLASSSLKVLK